MTTAQVQAEKWRFLSSMVDEIVEDIFKYWDGSGTLSRFQCLPSLDAASRRDQQTREWVCTAPDCDARYSRSNSRMTVVMHHFREHTNFKKDLKGFNREKKVRLEKEVCTLPAYLKSLLLCLTIDGVTRDFIKTGDGQRLWMAKKFALVIWCAAKYRARARRGELTKEESQAKANHNPVKYCWITILALIDARILPKDVVLRMMHDGIVNTSGVPGAGHPIDLYVEHCVKSFKRHVGTFIRNSMRPFLNASLSSSGVRTILLQYDVDNACSKYRPAHPTNMTASVLRISKYLLNAWKADEPLSQFRRLRLDVSDDLDLEHCGEWVTKHLLFADADALRTNDAIQAGLCDSDDLIAPAEGRETYTMKAHLTEELLAVPAYVAASSTEPINPNSFPLLT